MLCTSQAKGTGTHAKLLLNSRIQIKQELDLNNHPVLFPETKPQAMKFSKAKVSFISHFATCARSHGTHRQKELPGWAWRSYAELLSAATHSSITLTPHGSFMAPASFPAAAKYVKQAARDLWKLSVPPALQWHKDRYCCSPCCSALPICYLLIWRNSSIKTMQVFFLGLFSSFVLKLLPLQLTDFSKSLKRAVGFNDM